MSETRRSFTGADGKRHFVRGKDPVDVAVKIELLKEKIRKQTIIVDESVTVSEWSQNYLDVIVRPSVNDRYAKDIERVIRTRILPEIGSLKIRQVRTIHLQKILIANQDKSYSYRYKLVLELKRLFKQARMNRLIVEDPAEGLRLPSRNDETIGRALTDEERAAVESFIPKHRFGLAVALMLYAGLRDQEVIALTKSKVDLERRVLIIDRAYKADGTIGPPKSKSGNRRVPIQDKLLELLEPVVRKGRLTDPVVTQTNGKRFESWTFRRAWANYLRELNLSLGAQTFRLQLVDPTPISMQLRPYYLRHTFCTDCEKKGLPVQVTSRLMGHSGISVTLRYYTHESREVQEMALAALNGEGWHASGTPSSPN